MGCNPGLRPVLASYCSETSKIQKGELVTSPVFGRRPVANILIFDVVRLRWHVSADPLARWLSLIVTSGLGRTRGVGSVNQHITVRNDSEGRVVRISALRRGKG